MREIFINKMYSVERNDLIREFMIPHSALHIQPARYLVNKSDSGFPWNGPRNKRHSHYALPKRVYEASKQFRVFKRRAGQFVNSECRWVEKFMIHVNCALIVPWNLDYVLSAVNSWFSNSKVPSWNFMKLQS